MMLFSAFSQIETERAIRNLFLKLLSQFISSGFSMWKKVSNILHSNKTAPIG